jgi:hypothetical protein
MYVSKRLLPVVLVAGLAGCSGASVGPAHRSSAAMQPVTGKAKAGAGPAAAHFYALYTASQFAASWQLLTPATRRLVPVSVWVAVHNACATGAARTTRAIKTVTVFGNAAIVTTTSGQGKGSGSEDLFSYIDGRWDYSPGYLGVYQHKSVTADVAAAKAEGLCTGRRAF